MANDIAFEGTGTKPCKRILGGSKGLLNDHSDDEKGYANIIQPFSLLG